MENLHPGTLIAALAGGGLLCASPDGVRIFGEDGRLLLGGGRPRGQDLRISVPTSARRHCPWGANAPAALTLVLDTAAGGEARNNRGRGGMMGETYELNCSCCGGIWRRCRSIFVVLRRKRAYE